MYRQLRRKNTFKKIRERKELLEATDNYDDLKDDGYLKNNNEMNRLMSNGRSEKTNHKKGHSNYRRSGRYGKGREWLPRDYKQIEDMNIQEEEHFESN